jgi:hypothetical protein
LADYLDIWSAAHLPGHADGRRVVGAASEPAALAVTSRRCGTVRSIPTGRARRPARTAHV